MVILCTYSTIVYNSWACHLKEHGIGQRGEHIPTNRRRQSQCSTTVPQVPQNVVQERRVGGRTPGAGAGNRWNTIREGNIRRVRNQQVLTQDENVPVFMKLQQRLL
ncbi:hypothetical protein CBL_14291 [Carabus blaptoides fortunei]